jgi:hypothetical protein
MNEILWVSEELGSPAKGIPVIIKISERELDLGARFASDSVGILQKILFQVAHTVVIGLLVGFHSEPVYRKYTRK